MRLDCVVVSVDCADYLAHTIPQNKSLFDRQVVITSPKDVRTRRVCDHYHIECFVTNAFYENGDKFNKGRAINAALEHMAATGGFTGWMIHKDADISLPPRTRQILESIDLNEQFLYGIDRLMCPNYENWARFVQHPMSQHELAYVHLGPWPIGTRVCKLEHGGWIPLGFFQLFHRHAHYLGTPLYPTEWDTAATSDLYFAYRWPRTHRHLLPEIAAFHLATEDITNSKMGLNWSKRTSMEFGPKDPFNLHASYRPEAKPDPNGE